MYLSKKTVLDLKLLSKSFLQSKTLYLLVNSCISIRLYDWSFMATLTTRFAFNWFCNLVSRQGKNQNQSWLARMRFPALFDVVFALSFDWFTGLPVCHLWLARVMTSGLVWCKLDYQPLFGKAAIWRFYVACASLSVSADRKTGAGNERDQWQIWNRLGFATLNWKPLQTEREKTVQHKVTHFLEMPCGTWRHLGVSAERKEI